MPRLRLGPNLIESLVAMGVAVALAGVASPLLVSAKNHAAASAEFSQLRKLALAQGMYTADTGGIPTSTLPLVEGGYVSQDTCASPQDETLRGIANEYDIELSQTSSKYGHLPVGYRSSYLGIREFGYPTDWVETYETNPSTSGWLVSLTTTKLSLENQWGSMYSGDYRRVCLDGSVKTRRHSPVLTTSIDGPVREQHGFFLFLDGTNEWKRKFLSGFH